MFVFIQFVIGTIKKAKKPAQSATQKKRLKISKTGGIGMV